MPRPGRRRSVWISAPAAGSDGAGDRAEIQSMPQVERPLRLTTSDREMAGLLRGVRVVFQKKGVYISCTQG